MFMTIKLKLPYDKSLLKTGERYREACKKVLNYGFSARTFNKNKFNRSTYENVRKAIPTLLSALVQTVSPFRQGGVVDSSGCLNRQSFVFSWLAICDSRTASASIENLFNFLDFQTQLHSFSIHFLIIGQQSHLMNFAVKNIRCIIKSESRG